MGIEGKAKEDVNRMKRRKGDRGKGGDMIFQSPSIRHVWKLFTWGHKKSKGDTTPRYCVARRTEQEYSVQEDNDDDTGEENVTYLLF